ncbi:MAG: hypothetical protein JJ957_20065 [Pseudomonadales bacterium]|nr:hypothetical protein [Pseudomonadales bacterium]
MYELFDGLISIGAGVYVYLLATGKAQISKDEERSKAWVEKFGRAMKVIGPLLVAFGLFRISGALLG